MAHVPVVRKSDNRRGIVASIVFLFVVLFLLFFVKYQEPDPPKVTESIPITMTQNGIENFEVDNGGGGAPSENTNPTEENQQDPEEQPVQDESPVETQTGQGDSESDVTSETESQSNPFSGDGSGGQGTSGNGTGFGSDDGPGTGNGDPGTGAAGDRVRLTNLRTNPSTPNDQVCQIALKLTVDSRGQVVAASSIRDNTTTSNQRLIEEVIQLVKEEVKFKEKPGARNETAYYTVEVQPGG